MAQVWGLTDNRAGNVSQVRGVVESLSLPHDFRSVSYSPLVHLPNGLRGHGLRGVDVRKSTPLGEPWPDIVVSAGRRLAPVALYIKRQNPRVMLVQMMSPGLAASAFDVLALPTHDKTLNLGNVVRTIGAPHHVTPEKLKAAAAHFEPHFAACPGFRIGVLIGGDTSHGKMREDDIRRLQSHLQRIAGLSSLLITTSRRTPAFAVPQLRAGMKERPHAIYAYGSTSGENPYLGILGAADMIIVTGESISMCSEACGTGKPVYVFSPVRTLSEKHRRFLSTLFAQGFARPLEEYDPSWRPTKTLDEAGRLAMIIKERLADG